MRHTSKEMMDEMHRLLKKLFERIGKESHHQFFDSALVLAEQLKHTALFINGNNCTDVDLEHLRRTVTAMRETVKIDPTGFCTDAFKEIFDYIDWQLAEHQ